MSPSFLRSSPTSSEQAGEHTRPSRPRLQLEFSAGGRWLPGTPDLVRSAIGEDASAQSGKGEERRGVGTPPYYIEVFLKAVSAAVADEGLVGIHASSEDEDARTVDVEARISRALDLDLEASLGEVRQLQSTRYAALARLLKSWTKASGESRKILMDRMVDAALDPLTWRTAFEDVGPRPQVSVVLFLPGSFMHETKTRPLHDIDTAIVYRGAARAAEEIEGLATAMAPDILLPTPAVVLQARRNAAARTGLLSEFGALTAAQVAELAGSDAKNTSALAGRWRREGRLVAVEHHGTIYYPAFQFDVDGKPKQAVADVLKHLGDPSMTAWQQALWFTSANGWLDGRRPVDLFDNEVDAVVAAAREALREPVG
jgi:hypothetical protein